MKQETPHKGLLLRGDASDLQQGETLLTGAIQEGKSAPPESFYHCVCDGQKTNGALYEHIQHRLKEIKDLTVLLSSAEHLQNLLMSMVKDPNPLEDDNVQDAQLGREDGYGAGHSNITASAMKGKANAYKNNLH